MTAVGEHESPTRSTPGKPVILLHLLVANYFGRRLYYMITLLQLSQGVAIYLLDLKTPRDIL